MLKRSLEATTSPITKKTKPTLRICSWNVAGLAASLKKGFYDTVNSLNADILLLQETKLNPANKDFCHLMVAVDEKEFAHQYWSHSSARKGYSGSAVLSKIKPLSVSYTIGDADQDLEGRYIILEFERFHLIACYIMNASTGLKRLPEKRIHMKHLAEFIKGLKKPVILGGDVNVAHTEHDLARPKTNAKTPGFTIEERDDFSMLLEDCKMVDTYRSLHPTTYGKYTYYSYRFNARQKNLGWRLDYFVVSDSLMTNVLSSEIGEITEASDHVPITLELSI